MKRNTKDIILKKYDTIYRLCVAKYFALIKSSENQAKFFSTLAAHCDKLVQNSRCSGARYLSRLNSKEIDTKKLQQDFLRDKNKVLWRKNLVDAAYLFGYGNSVADQIINNGLNHGQDKARDILTPEKLWSFLHEIEQIIKKEDDFEVMSDNLKRLFQLYNLSFTEN